jgi:hypothetical protein
MRRYDWQWDSNKDDVAHVVVYHGDDEQPTALFSMLLPDRDERVIGKVVVALNAYEGMADALVETKILCGTPESDLLDFAKIIGNISDALAEYSGEGVQEAHNRICDTQVKYLGDNLWQKE